MSDGSPQARYFDKAIDEIYSDLDKINQERMYEMPIAMAIVDNEGIIYWYNQAFGKAFKKEKEGLILSLKTT